MSKMHHLLRLAVLAGAVSVLGAVAGPDPAATPDPARPVSTPPAVATVAAPEPLAATPPVLSPMMQEIASRLERMRSEVGELEARIAATGDPAESTRLQLAIERAKVDTELDVLRIQATWARREGRTEAAAELEAAIELMTSPPPLPSAPVGPRDSRSEP